MYCPLYTVANKCQPSNPIQSNPIQPNPIYLKQPNKKYYKTKSKTSKLAKLA